MLARLRWPALMMTSGAIGMATGVMMLLLKREREARLNDHPFIAKAVEIVRQEPTATNLLGSTDFEVGRASLFSRFTRIKDDNVQVSVPLKGKSDNASLLIYAYRRPETDPEKPGRMKIYKLELAFAKIEDKRLVLLDAGPPPEPPKPEPKTEVLTDKKLTKLDKKALKNADVNTRAEYMVQMALSVDPDAKLKPTVSYKIDDVLKGDQ